MYSNDIQRYVQDVCKVTTLTCEEQQALAKRVHAGDQDARSKLIQSNLRLVQDIGKQYINRGIPFFDIIEKGNLGLIRAVEQFGHQRGIKFCTFASWWITRTITQALANHIRVVGLPIQLSELTTVYTCTIRKLTQQLGREPSNEEIAKKMRMSVSKIQVLSEMMREICTLKSLLDDDGDETFIQSWENATSKTSSRPWENTLIP